MRPLTPRLALAAFFMAAAPSALADVIQVPGDAATIQAGLDLAQPGDIVRVGDGTWTGPGNRDLVLPGFDMVLESASGAEACVIDSQGTVAEPHRALTISGPRSRATIVRGFTFTGGETEVGAVADIFNAGGILIRDGSPTVSDCRFIDNRCSCWGGAICISGAESPRITRCYFEGNFSGDEGGAVFGWGSNGTDKIHVDNSVFIRNSAGNAGGAIFGFSSFQLDHLTVVENRAVNSAGAIQVSSSDITNSIIWGNHSNHPAAIQGWNFHVDFCVTQEPHAGTGNMQVDPLFRADGWHLRRSVSPCIDAGDPLSRPHRGMTDIDGQRRMGGLWVDIGADETRIVDRMPR